VNAGPIPGMVLRCRPDKEIAKELFNSQDGAADDARGLDRHKTQQMVATVHTRHK
jgi:hypothetical protein